MPASFDRRASESVPEPPARAAAPTRASHDVVAPPALIAFMLKSWKPRPRRAPKKVAHAAAHLARRRALSALFPGEALVIPSGHEKVRANDTHHRFRPGTDFFYLTGNHEPDCVLVMLPTARGHEDVLFVEPNPGRADKTFFTDRNKGELWVGPRAGVPESRARFGVHRCAGLDALDARLDELQAKGARVLRGLSERVDAKFKVTRDTKKRDQQLAAALSELRLKKDPAELRELSQAIASTHRGFDDVIVRMRAARSEREIEGVFGLRARVEGNDVGYGTIAASGHHACTLHWTRNDGAIAKGDLLLLDAGVEGNSLYTADITRTLPISGKFTEHQRAVYDLVAAAQAAAFAEVRPGRDFLAPNRAAMKVLTQGLIALGVLKCGLDEALDDAHQYYKRYTLHNVSHMLGLDVHDCAKARQETYKFGKLEPGMVLTVEPGLYFQLDDLTVPRHLRGIGVRIEDDVVVTKSGMKNLSEAIPRDSRDVEAWIARVWRKPRA